MAEEEVKEQTAAPAEENKEAGEADASKEEKKKKKDKKKKDKEEEVVDENADEDGKLGIGGRILMFFISLVILVIWLGIFALLVKMDVGGLGTMLFPVLKDVPYVNQILPGIETYVPEEESEYNYETVEEAVARIKELEQENQTLSDQITADEDKINELSSASDELATYKQNEQEFEDEKEKFYEEVVFSDNAPDIDEYKSYYESIEPENAEAIYKQVVSQLQEDEELEDYIETYSSMKAKNAATIFDSMTDNFELVAEILQGMDTSTRADILANMSAENAAILTQMMEP